MESSNKRKKNKQEILDRRKQDSVSDKKKSEIKKTNQHLRKIFYAILILIPIIFFILLEFSLRIFNYGYDLSQWVNVTKGKLVLNTDIAHKYFFNTKSVPYSNQNAFDEIKTDSSFRIFVLGGSAAAGYPYLPIGSFSNYLQNRLTLVYPHSKIEVVNCSMTAVNSYTIRDLIPGILQQKPDLIIIYAGHNEYYGALGVGSMENLGTSRTLINLVISLEKFKTFQLLRNLIKSVASLFYDNESLTGTLMSRMAKEQFIGFQSDIYLKGLSQFEGNMGDILQMTNNAKVPVMIGILTSNLKDQKPFVSEKLNGFPPAYEIFEKAEKELIIKNYKVADSLFRFARDLDALRFRAPSKMNEIVKSLGKKYNAFVVDIDSAFSAISPDDIVGDNLMTDHLHPTLQGYQYMGKVYFDAMKDFKLLPKTKPINLSDEKQDSLTTANFPFSYLDSIIAVYRIKLLKNDWPYKDKTKKLPDYVVMQPKNHVDSVAAKFLVEDSDWEKTHRELAEWYAKKRDIKSFLNIMNVLISQYPIILSYYDYTANILMNHKMFDEAYIYLKKKYKERPDAFSTKWLGIIDLSKNRILQAKSYLLESLKYAKNDAQVYYNLSGCYVAEGKYEAALNSVKEALKINPSYREANQLNAQLTAATIK